MDDADRYRRPAKCEIREEEMDAKANHGEALGVNIVAVLRVKRGVWGVALQLQSSPMPERRDAQQGPASSRHSSEPGPWSVSSPMSPRDPAIRGFHSLRPRKLPCRLHVALVRLRDYGQESAPQHMDVHHYYCLATQPQIEHARDDTTHNAPGIIEHDHALCMLVPGASPSTTETQSLAPALPPFQF